MIILNEKVIKSNIGVYEWECVDYLMVRTYRIETDLPE